MFSFFKKEEPEAAFIKRAERAMESADSFTQMLLVMQLLNEAAQKKFHTAQIHLIEKYTQWENDPLMSVQREAAILLRDGANGSA